jgi:uncharacterized repeat protein (TIGR02543 family)
MCKNHTVVFDGGRVDYSPIEPTTTFSPSDNKAEFLTTVSLTQNETIEWQWSYRNDSSKSWVNCFLPYEKRSYTAAGDGVWAVEGHFDIAGYWPAVYYPRAYRVDVYYLNNSLLFSEFFEVTNGGLNSPRMCMNIETDGTAVNIKSRFTVGNDTQAYHYLCFDNMAYFNEETDSSHNFTTVWIEPNGTVYKTHACTFSDYKDSDIGLNYWKHGLISNDSITIDSNTPVGNWKVEVYMDNYYSNDTWIPYGPVAVTPFVVGNEPVADWTFMAYLDGDNTLENASIDVFLNMAKVISSPNVNIVAQLDRTPGQTENYSDWTDCKRFDIKYNMTPIPENAVQNLSEVDMGDPITLRDFLNWSIDNYPANRFALAIWDHGTGFVGVCYDNTSQNDALLLPELSEAMTGLPVIIDDVLIDACSMSMAEVAYQIKDFANVLIGPEGLGYAPAPYDNYLTHLTNNPSTSPYNFAQEIVNDYINWCNPIYEIPNATMSAIDLTKITSFTAAIDTFSAVLKEEETLWHEQIDLARNQTTGYQGPYAGFVGYYFDLYDFAQRTLDQVPDGKLRNASSEVIAALSSGNAIIMAKDKNDPGSYGMAIFFPGNKTNYDSFATLYEDTAFAEDTQWDEFLKYHLSGKMLTIQTDPAYPNMSVSVDQDNYTTAADGELQLYLPSGSHTVGVATIISTAHDSRGVFAKWEDGQTSNPRTFSLDEAVTTEVEYETQYLMILQTNFGTTEPIPGEHWCNISSTVKITATPPSSSSGEKYDWIGWTQMDSGNSNTTNPISIPMDGPINVTAVWKHEFYLTITSPFGSPSPSSEWTEVGTTVSESVISPLSESSGTQLVCTGWTGTGSVPPSGTSTATNFTLNEPSSLQWNWKTQYLLTVHTDPMGLNPQPSISPTASWYDNYTKVTCTAQQIGGYTFQLWSTQSASYPVGVNPINITMDGQYDLIAHYVPSQSWWDILANPNVMQALLAVLGTVITVSLVGGTWFRSRKRRDVVKQFLAEIDDIYLRLKRDPKKCEEELYTLRNTILEGLTGGKITEDNYDVLDKRIDKYVNELAEKQEDKTRSGEKLAKGKE